MLVSRTSRSRTWRWISSALIYSTVLMSGRLSADQADQVTSQLRAKYTTLGPQLHDNQFQRALYLDSAESPSDLKSEIFAVVDYPFATVNTALNNPAHWCDVLILHINVKSCQVSNKKVGTLLAVNLGRKHYQALSDTFRLAFNYRAAISTPDYFALELSAEDGPLSTHDYRIRVEATPLDGGRSFLHFTYTYAFGHTGRLAMQSYLMTLGKDKVGFTIIGKGSDGRPIYIQGIRGAVERNAMRYYLAIDAYLAALSLAPEQQLMARLQHWYNATDQYALQLREIGREDYLAMKRREYRRQQG